MMMLLLFPAGCAVPGWNRSAESRAKKRPAKKEEKWRHIKHNEFGMSWNWANHEVARWKCGCRQLNCCEENKKGCKKFPLSAVFRLKFSKNKKNSKRAENELGNNKKIPSFYVHKSAKPRVGVFLGFISNFIWLLLFWWIGRRKYWATSAPRGLRRVVGAVTNPTWLLHDPSTFLLLHSMLRFCCFVWFPLIK